jgi:hypothetical protein
VKQNGQRRLRREVSLVDCYTRIKDLVYIGGLADEEEVEAI